MEKEITIVVNIENKVDIIAPEGVSREDIREAIAHAFEALALKARSGTLEAFEEAEPVHIKGDAPLN